MENKGLYKLSADHSPYSIAKTTFFSLLSIYRIPLTWEKSNFIHSLGPKFVVLVKVIAPFGKGSMKPFSAFLYELAKQLTSMQNADHGQLVSLEQRHTVGLTLHKFSKMKNWNHYLRPLEWEKDVLAQLHWHLKEPHPGHHQVRHLLSFPPSIILSQKYMCAIIRVCD